jgi:tetratricopeptide (TPR) repeat protein
MGGEGSIQQMINSLKNNKKLLRRKNRFEKEKSFLSIDKDSYKTKQKTFKSKKAAPELLNKIRKETKRASNKSKLLFGFIALIFLIFMLLFLSDLYNSDQKHLIKTLNEKGDDKNNLALSFINKGDGWFKESKWDAAIFYYRKAKKIYPDNFDIEYRIVHTMSLKCKYEFEKCRETKEILDSLIFVHPGNLKLKSLKENLMYEYDLED